METASGDYCAGLRLAHLRVGILEWSPFVIAESQGKGESTYRGFSIDLLNIVATACNFSYSLVPPRDKEWGDKRDGNWTGLVGQLLRKETDLTVASLSITEERSEAADYTVPYYYASSKMAVRKESSGIFQWGVFLRPFHWQMYLLLPAVFVFCLLLMRIVTSGNQLLRHGRSLSVLEITELMFGSAVQEAMPLQWTDGPPRVFFAAWCLTSLALASCYTSKLTSLLVGVTPPPLFTSVASVVERKDFHWGVIGGARGLTYLRLAYETDLQALYQGLMTFAQDDPDVLSHDPEVHLAKVLEGHYAFLSDSVTVDLWEREHCEVTGVLENFFGQYLYAFHTQRNSSLTAPLTMALLRLYDTGVMSYLHDKWFPSQAGCQDNLSTPPSVTMATLQGPFYVALVALVVAAGVLFIERGVSWYMRRTTMVHDLSVMSAGQ